MNENQQSQLKDLITKGKEQGFLTYAQVNDHLPELKQAGLVFILGWFQNNAHFASQAYPK